MIGESKMSQMIDHGLNERIATALYSCRDWLDVSRKELALMIGTSAAMIGKIENRVRKLKITEFLIVCSALGLDPNKLLQVVLADDGVIPEQLKLSKQDIFIGIKSECFIGASFKDTAKRLKIPLATILDDKRQQSGYTMRSAANEIGIAHSFFAKLKNGRGVCYSELVFLCELYKSNSLLVVEELIEQINGNDQVCR